MIVLPNTKLFNLFCNNTYDLGSLDISKNTSLNTLQCNNTQLAFLDLSKNLDLNQMDCSDNFLLTTICISPVQVKLAKNCITDARVNYTTSCVTTPVEETNTMEK